MQLVADANVLLSAVIGGRATLILEHPEVEAVFTPATAIDEVSEYLPVLARKRRLQLDTDKIASLVTARRDARKAKDWVESDRIRDELAAMGVVLHDNKDGATSWEVKR